MKFSPTILLFLILFCPLKRVQSQTQEGTVGDSRGYNQRLKRVQSVKVLIVDGQNNHDWETTTDSLRATLEAAGIFEVSVSTAPRSAELKTIRPPREESLKADYDAFNKLKSAAFQPAREALDESLEKLESEFRGPRCRGDEFQRARVEPGDKNAVCGVCKKRGWAGVGSCGEQRLPKLERIQRHDWHGLATSPFGKGDQNRR